MHYWIELEIRLAVWILDMVIIIFFVKLMFFIHLLVEFSINFGSDENKWTRNDKAGG